MFFMSPPEFTLVFLVYKSEYFVTSTYFVLSPESEPVFRVIRLHTLWTNICFVSPPEFMRIPGYKSKHFPYFLFPRVNTLLQVFILCRHLNVNQYSDLLDWIFCDRVFVLCYHLNLYLFLIKRLDTFWPSICFVSPREFILIPYQ